MANEIEVSISISAAKGGMNVSRSESFKVDMTGDAMTHSVQEISTTAEVLVEADALDNPGWVFVKNLHASNYVELGTVEVTSSDGDDDAEYAVKVSAGESCVFQTTTAVYAKASGTGTNVEYIIIEL